MSFQPRLLTRFGDVFFAYDKPAGMAVHPNAEGTPDLVTWLQKQLVAITTTLQYECWMCKAFVSRIGER